MTIEVHNLEVLFPFPESKQTIECLDDTTLKYQCYEGLIILRVLVNYYKEHGLHTPTVEKHVLDAWRDNEFILIHHLTNLLDKADKRSIKVYKFSVLDQILEKHPQIVEKAAKRQMAAGATSVPYPAWISDPTIQNRHRRMLLTYNPEWYAQFNWDVPADPQES